MSNIIGNAKVALNNYNKEKINNLKLIKEIINNILENKNIILEANKEDISQNNGFELDFNIIKEILNNIKNQKTLYKNKILSPSKKHVIEYDNLGILETFFDGNTYIFIEMAIKTIISHNTMIFISQQNNMKFTNTIIFEIISKTLDLQKIDKNVIQLVYDYNILKYCTNNLVIKKAFAIGNTDLHNTIKRVSKLDTCYIGYNDCDIYVEDISDIDIVKKFINENNNILFKVYIKKSLEMVLDDAIYVDDLKECMKEVGFDSCNYCNMLFSKNKQTKIDFSEQSKAKFILINKFMNMNQIANIDMNNFYCKKNIII